VLDPLYYLRFVVALGVVLALIAGLAWVLRRTSLGRAAIGRNGRLSVVESMSLDPRRRLLLVRRDGVEHLLLLGATGELVVEAGIRPTPPRATTPMGPTLVAATGADGK
jgi:flagellar protein FliO/FliZ